MRTKAFRRGVAAHRRGVELHGNPFLSMHYSDRDGDYMQWRDGWIWSMDKKHRMQIEAEQDAKRKVKAHETQGPSWGPIHD